MSTIEETSGRGVKVVYGPRTANEPSMGRGLPNSNTKEVRISLAGTDVQAGLDVFDEVILPAGALPRRVVVEIEEVFVLGGTTPTILFGTETSEVTNGFVVSEAQAEAAATYEITSFAGTWAAALAADTAIGVALGGSTPTVTSAGVINVSIEYDLLK